MEAKTRRARKRSNWAAEIRIGLRSRIEHWALRLGLPILTLAHARGADDQISYRHESYQEDNNRIRVETETALIQAILAPWLDVKVTAVYDAISGATPTGAPAPDSFTLHPTGTSLSIPGTAITTFKKSTSLNAVSGASSSTSGSAQRVSATDVPTGQMMDKRTAVDLTTGLTFGPHRIIPEFSYSEEIDYISYAGALNYELSLNEKNTVLKAGWSHAADRILPNANTFLQQQAFKNSDDYMVGIAQLLGPKTVLNANFTFGHGEGYFDDPYRGVIFVGTMPSSFNTTTIYPEKRPSIRSKQVLALSLTQAVTPLCGSVEASYRFYHDSFEVYGQTAQLAWFQKIGSRVVVSPSFRYYWQSAASFYGTIFPGDPVTDPGSVPTYYSSDYRLSKMQTFTGGIEAKVKALDWLSFEGGYQRYVMQGLDGVTSQSAYPSANIFTIGATITF